MAKCMYCSNEVEPDDLFCIHCGQAVIKSSPFDSSVELDSSNQFTKKGHSKMQKWEYVPFSYSATGFMGLGKGAYVIKTNGETIKVGGANFGDAIKYLNKLGNRGWELVNFQVNQSNVREFVLKRTTE